MGIGRRGGGGIGLGRVVMMVMLGLLHLLGLLGGLHLLDGLGIIAALNMRDCHVVLLKK